VRQGGLPKLVAEALVAAELAADTRDEGLNCDTCWNTQRLREGQTELFRQSCTADRCQLRRYIDLPNLELWQWFDELIGWQRQGLEGLVSELMVGLSVSHVRAFCVFRSRLVRPVEKPEQG